MSAPAVQPPPVVARALGILDEAGWRTERRRDGLYDVLGNHRYARPVVFEARQVVSVADCYVPGFASQYPLEGRG